MYIRRGAALPWGRMSGLNASAVRPMRPSLTEDDAEHLAEVMRALASPLRLRILSVLRDGPTTVTDLSQRLDAAQAAVSNHLRLLRHLSLVSGERRGRHIYYHLFDEHVADLLDQAVDHVTHLPHRADPDV